MKKYAVTDERLSLKCQEGLLSRGFELIPLPPFSLLDAPVSAHPDMLFFLGDTLICHEEYFKSAKSSLEKIASLKGFEIELSKEPVSKEYPSDVLFNAAEIGRFIICRSESISEHIKKYADICGKSIVNVKQGYAKCSVCKVSDDAIITSDKSIAKAAKAVCLSVLNVDPAGVSLNGYGCGFIGGASGCDGKNTYFCGNVELHPNGKEIIDFCDSNGAPAVSLSDEPLYDVGTIFFI